MATRKIIRDADDLVALVERLREAGVLEFEVEGHRVVLAPNLNLTPPPAYAPESKPSMPEAKSYYDKLFPAGKPEFPRNH
jgi:uncharacterized protein (DUF362 family)